MADSIRARIEFVYQGQTYHGPLWMDARLIRRLMAGGQIRGKVFGPAALIAIVGGSFGTGFMLALLLVAGAGG